MLVRHFWVHAALLFSILLLLIPFIDNGSFSVPDEGLYAAQADQLTHGSWRADRPTADVDEDGAWSPLIGAVAVGDQQIPYARRPLYPLALTPFFGIAGIAGGMVLSVIGTWVAAVAGARVARHLDRRGDVLALWALGIGSPLLFDTHVLMAHSLAAGSAALVVLAVVGLLRLDPMTSTPQSPGRTAAWAVLAAVSATTLVLLRTEGAFVVGALAVSICFISISRHDHRLAIRKGWLIAGVGLGSIGLLAYRLNDVWATAITAGAGPEPNAFSREADALRSAWVSLIRPWFYDIEPSAAMTLALVSSLTAPVLARWQRTRLLAIGLLVMGAAASTFQAFQDPGLISGLLPVVPWMIVGVLCLNRSSLGLETVRLLLGSSVIAATAITWTAYGIGGAMEWGGRFYHVLLPLIGPVAVTGLLVAKDRYRLPEWRAGAAALAATTAAISWMAIQANIDLRATTAQLESIVSHAAADSGAQIVVLAPLAGDGTSRTLWRVNHDQTRLLNVPGLVSVPLLLDGLPDRIDRVAMIANASSAPLVGNAVKATQSSEWSVQLLPIPAAPGIETYELIRQ